MFRFQTAWTVPTPVLHRLAALHPDLRIVVDSYDECHNFAAHGVGSAGTFQEALFAGTPAAFEPEIGGVQQRPNHRVDVIELRIVREHNPRFAGGR
jgi:hypothetical protein